MSDDERRAVGARIRQARQERGLTQTEFAKLLDVTTRSVQNYESGAIVPYRHLHRIEHVTFRPTTWILEGREASDLDTTIAALHEAIERHSELLRRQLDLLSANVDRLRTFREQRYQVDGSPRDTHATKGRRVGGRRT